MDINGIHVDGAVLLAAIALLNTALLLIGNHTASKTHDAVNGMAAVKETAAHAAGVVEGVQASAAPQAPIVIVPPSNPPAA